MAICRKLNKMPVWAVENPTLSAIYLNTWNQQGGIAGVHSKLPSCFINPICQQRLQGAGLRCLCHVFRVRNSLRLTISTVLSETNP
jgi:hypothetical protein